MKEKAKAEAQRLLNQFTFASIYFTDREQGAKLNAKQCAEIAVKELIKEQNMWQNGQPEPVKHWEQVLEELNKL